MERLARDYSYTSPTKRSPLYFSPTSTFPFVYRPGFTPYWHSSSLPVFFLPSPSRGSNKSRPSGTFIIRGEKVGEDTKAARNRREPSSSSSSSVKSSRGAANGLVLETSRAGWGYGLPRQRLSGTRRKGGIFRPWTMDQIRLGCFNAETDDGILSKTNRGSMSLGSNRDKWILALYIGSHLKIRS